MIMKTKIYGKWDIQNNLNYTIDLKWIIDLENEQKLIDRWILEDYPLKEKLMSKFTKIRDFLILSWIMYILLWLYGIYQTHADEEPLNTIISSLEKTNTKYGHIIGCVNKYTLKTRAPMENIKNWYAKCYYWDGWDNITLRYWTLSLYEKYNIPLTRKLDLLSINSLECADKLWLCNRNGSDLWPFQINYIHGNSKDERTKFIFNYSKEIIWDNNKIWIERMYALQMLWTKKRMDDYESSWNCNTYINKDRFLCQAMRHNWNNDIALNWKLKKENYANKWWAVRQYISNYLFIQ